MHDDRPEPYRPSPDGHLRVSDDERDTAVELLAQAATDGRLTLDEYSQRSDKALTARTRADLAEVTGDLALASPARPRADDDYDVDRVVAVLGSEHRRGRWPVPERMCVRAVLGEAKIELQDATLHARHTVIDAHALFGSIEICVPEGVDVYLTGTSIFGSRGCTAGAAPPGAPVVEVRGRAVFGEVTVRRPRWREGVRRTIEDQVARRRP